MIMEAEKPAENMGKRPSFSTERITADENSREQLTERAAFLEQLYTEPVPAADHPDLLGAVNAELREKQTDPKAEEQRIAMRDLAKRLQNADSVADVIREADAAGPGPDEDATAKQTLVSLTRLGDLVERSQRWPGATPKTFTDEDEQQARYLRLGELLKYAGVAGSYARMEKRLASNRDEAVQTKMRRWQEDIQEAGRNLVESDDMPPSFKQQFDVENVAVRQENVVEATETPPASGPESSEADPAEVETASDQVTFDTGAPQIISEAVVQPSNETGFDTAVVEQPNYASSGEVFQVDTASSDTADIAENMSSQEESAEEPQDESQVDVEPAGETPSDQVTFDTGAPQIISEAVVQPSNETGFDTAVVEQPNYSERGEVFEVTTAEIDAGAVSAASEEVEPAADAEVVEPESQEEGRAPEDQPIMRETGFDQMADYSGRTEAGPKGHLAGQQEAANRARRENAEVPVFDPANEELEDLTPPAETTNSRIRITPAEVATQESTGEVADTDLLTIENDSTATLDDELVNENGPTPPGLTHFEAAGTFDRRRPRRRGLIGRWWNRFFGKRNNGNRNDLAA